MSLVRDTIVRLGSGMRRLLTALPLLLALGLPQPALAIDPPYEPQMERLAERLGSRYFLIPLC